MKNNEKEEIRDPNVGKLCGNFRKHGVDCSETTTEHCNKCGWNYVVEALRKARIMNPYPGSTNPQ